MHLLQPLKDFLKFMSSKPGKHIILGDFNSPDIDWVSLNAPKAGKQNDFLQSFLKYGFRQHVTDPTRSKNILDLIFTDDANLVSNVNVCIPFSTSDHSIISAKIALHVEPVNESKIQWNRGGHRLECYF